MATTATETKQPPTKTDTTKKRVTLTQRDARLGLWLMSPTLLVVLAIVIFPLLWSILLSFQRMRLIQIGRADFFEPLTLANYERVLGSSNFWSSLAITFIYTFGSVVLVDLRSAYLPRWRYGSRSVAGTLFVPPIYCRTSHQSWQ